MTLATVAADFDFLWLNSKHRPDSYKALSGICAWFIVFYISKRPAAGGFRFPKESPRLSHRTAAAVRFRDQYARIRTWCQRDGIGHRVAGGAWVVSRVALRMLLDGDDGVLRAYLSGDRPTELVARYYRRVGLQAVLDEMSITLTWPWRERLGSQAI
jgi:hypothetical protein